MSNIRSLLLIKIVSKTCSEISKLTKKLDGNVFSLKEEQFEDFALGNLMDKFKTDKIVSRNEIVKKLRK